MIVSLNEATGLATKAASGAGRPWGLAQEAGYAVSALEAMRLPGAACLLDLLRATDGVACNRLRPTSTGAGVWAGEGWLCPLLTGAYIADVCSGDLQIRVQPVCAPLLMLPFARQPVAGVQLQWGDTCVVAGKVNAVVVGDVRRFSRSDQVKITSKPASEVAASQMTHASQSGPVDIADEIWEGLSALAHRTYVPATEASRLKGAGAGLTDND